MPLAVGDHVTALAVAAGQPDAQDYAATWGRTGRLENVGHEHPPTRLLVLREKDAMLEVAKRKLTPAQLGEVSAEIDKALSLPDDEATLVLATIKGAWEI
jgi:hypothetical protein